MQFIEFVCCVATCNYEVLTGHAVTNMIMILLDAGTVVSFNCFLTMYFQTFSLCWFWRPQCASL